MNLRLTVAAGVAAHTVVAIGLGVALLPEVGRTTSPIVVVALAAAFAAASLLPLHLDFRRSACTVVLDEAVVVVALFATGPVGVIVAATLGEALRCAVSRQRPLKASYNTAQSASAAAVAAMLFSVLVDGAPGALDPAAWLAALAAAVGYAIVNLASTSFVLTVAEQLDEAFLATVPTYAFTTSASTSLGVTVVALAGVHPVAPVLVLPLLVMTVVESRRMAAHRAERLRFERLYAASTRTSRLAGFEEVLAAHADEARQLVTGAVGVCCAPNADGRWSGMVVDDDGARPAEQLLVDALVEHEGHRDHGDDHRLPSNATRTALPSATDVVTASAGPDAAAKVILAVLREIGADDQSDMRVEVLSAFAGHTALGVANALLYDEVDAAYRHQLDLNRQKAEFVAAVSHELRTPLTTTLGAVQTVHRLGDRLHPRDRDQLLSDAIAQGQRLRLLIDDLLLVAAAEHRSMTVDLRHIPLSDMLAGVTATFGIAASERLRVSVDPGMTTLLTDEPKLHRVLTNLVENALKYAPEGHIDVHAGLDDESVVITVADRGPGVRPEDRERIFERFVQLDQSSTRARGGTGLGLHLCRQLVGLLGGTLTAGERPAGGGLFTLTLPLHPVGEAPDAPPHHDNSQNSQRAGTPAPSPEHAEAGT